MAVQPAPKKNSPCVCGSGKKFRKCCGSPKVWEAMRLQYQRRTAARARYESKFGKVKDIQYTDHNGTKLVVVGGEFYWPHPDHPWRSFPDFLDSHLKNQFGEKWWRTEWAKPLAECHPLVQAERALKAVLQRAPQKPGELVMVTGDGAAAEYALVCYDLYLARHHELFSRRILNRLRDTNQYHGARVELAAASAFLRAGFKLEMEDEKDGSRKHPEFVAVDPSSGFRIDVEAKRRHRRDGDSSERLGVEPLIRDAVEKVRDQPFALFLELNAPPREGRPLPLPWLEEINAALDAHARRPEPSSPNGKVDVFSLIIISNRWHQPGQPADFRRTTAVPINAMRPVPKAVFEAMMLAMAQAGTVPNEFPKDL